MLHYQITYVIPRSLIFKILQKKLSHSLQLCNRLLMIYVNEPLLIKIHSEQLLG